MIRLFFSFIILYWLFKAISRLFIAASSPSNQRTDKQSRTTFREKWFGANEKKKNRFKSIRKKMVDELSEDVEFEEL